ncbi:MAG: hypothetical protein JNL74_04760 [Fibrobacteres bacterium]|nr:hypothetical protein [Fibrobacterota bacterium]
MKALLIFFVFGILSFDLYAATNCDSMRTFLLSKYESLTPNEIREAWFRPKDSVLAIHWAKRKLSVMAESLKVYRIDDTSGHYDDLLLETYLLLGLWNEADRQIAILSKDSIGWETIVYFRLKNWDLEENLKMLKGKLEVGTPEFPKGSFRQQRLLALYELYLNKRAIGMNRLKEAYVRYKGEAGSEIFQDYIKSMNTNGKFGVYIYISTSDISIYNPDYSSVWGAGLGFSFGSEKIYGVWRTGFEHNALEKAVLVKRNDASFTSCKNFNGFGMDFGADFKVFSGQGYRLGLLGTIGYMITTYEEAETEEKLQEVSDINGCYSIGPSLSYTTLGGKYLFAELLFRHIPSNMKHQYPEFERSRVVLQVGFGIGGGRN